MKQCVVFLSLVLLFPAVLLFSQDLRLAEVSGEVRDMQGRPIAEASVVYSRLTDNKTYRFKTDENGRYYAIGILLGWYHLEVTGPTGKRIYSGKKFLQAGDSQKFNVTEIDLSGVAPKASLVPFKGPHAEELQNARAKAMADGKQLSPAELAELHNDNSLISRYNELLPSAEAALKNEEWPRAAELLRQLVEIAPYKWELYQNLGVIQRNLGQYEESAASFERGLQVLSELSAAKTERGKNASAAMMHTGKGEALTALSRFDEAAAQFRVAAELDPKPMIAYLHLCTAEYNSGHTDEAVTACSRAVAAEPDRLETYQVLGTLQSNLDRSQDAIRTYEKGIAIALENAHASRPSLKSNINSHHVGDPSRSIGESVRAAQMMQSLGNLYFQLKKYRRAAELFSQSAPLHPYPVLPLFNLCATLFDLNDFSAAVTACDRAIEADPKLADPYYVKAAALAGEAVRNGRLKPSNQTAATLEKYLQLAPDGFYANDARALLKQMKGRE
jgi:tetratricopeptide (TPR) repeat protein